MSFKVCLIGSGNWGSAASRIIGNNVLKHKQFNSQVKMWVYPEIFENQNLVDIINTEHINKKYLPNIKLPSNVIAVDNLKETVIDADLLVFVLPHQFLERTCNEIIKYLKKSAKAISLIKGIFCTKDKIELPSEFIKRKLNIPVSVLSGANVAIEIAQDKFAEATIGYSGPEISKTEAIQLQTLFHTPTFRVTAVNDVCGVEINGALKNIIAISAGFVDGLNYGSNTKAAILRIGALEIQKFAFTFFKEVKQQTFWESCGFADIITTCYSGRNRKCAEEFIRSGDSWDDIEKRLLNGQKLQGTLTCKEIYAFLKEKSILDDYPLFHQTYKVAFGLVKKDDYSSIVNVFMKEELPELVMKL